MLDQNPPERPSISDSLAAVLSPAPAPAPAAVAPPAAPATLHVGRPNIGNPERFLELARGILDRRWLSNNGPLVQEFEHRIADHVGVKHCICVCNATIGLEITTRAAGFTGEVLVPSYTFVATAHALQWQGITPVFADVDPRTHNLDVRQLARHLTPRTTGILATHVWGRPCDIEALSDFAHHHSLKLVFDAAHAFGCSHRGQMIGGFGLAEVFSFHATKFLNSFEGGAITTNDEGLAKRIRLMTNFGFAGFDNVVHVGTNGKMSEICAAMGLANLESIDALIETNRRNYQLYREQLAGIRGLELIEYDRLEENNFQYIVVEVDAARLRVSRDELVALLHRHGILARKYFWPGAHQMEPYRSLYPYSRMLLSNTESLAQRIVVLPTGTETKPEDIQRIGDLLREATGTSTRSNANQPVERTTAGTVFAERVTPVSPARPKPELEVNPRWSWAPFRNRAN
jgi:dTDP-4-amino-4,6-dideoxygalactose transaminase